MYWQTARPQPTPVADAPEFLHTFFVDIEGWYEISPHEAAVLSPYDLRLAALPNSLPLMMGEWRGAELPIDAEIIEWFDNPDLALQRQYTNARGETVRLTIIGSRGAKSFHIFEHTPATCYPLSGWDMVDEGLEVVEIRDGKITVRRGVAQNGDDALVVLYWYLWESPRRAATDGVLSMRATTPVINSEQETLEMLKTEFLGALFADVARWRRF